MRPSTSVALLLTVAATAPGADEISFRDLPNTDTRWQEARGVVDAPPAVVRAWMSDYHRWPALYSDVSTVEVLREEGPAVDVSFHSRLFNRTLHIRVRSTPEGFVYSGKDGSVTTEGKVWLCDAGNGRTRVIIQSYAHVGGFIGAFVTRGMIRDRQRHKLRSDLGDLQRAARRLVAERRVPGQ
jgi:hypothetical protein